MDCREFLGMLADSATFAAFMNAIMTSISYPSPGGKIHHLTKQLMDYLNNLAGYCETFNLLLKDYDGEDPTFMAPDLSSTVEEEKLSGGICDLSPTAVHFLEQVLHFENGSPMSAALEEEKKSRGSPGFSAMALHFPLAASILERFFNGSPMHPATGEENVSGGTRDFSPLAHQMGLVASILECNLNDMAEVYKETSVQYVFLLSNIHYMVHKVKNPRPGLISGDQWTRKLCLKFQQHEMNNERATWSSQFQHCSR